MLHFDESALTERLARLSVPQRYAFALACTERLRPYYSYPDMKPPPPALDSALRLLREIAAGDARAPNLATAIAACESELDTDDDAVASLLYTSRSLDNLQAAVFAARRAYEARDRLAMENMTSDSRNEPWLMSSGSAELSVARR